MTVLAGDRVTCLTEEARNLGLRATMVTVSLEIEQLRQIRNACREGFSHDHRSISQEEQWAWWDRMQGNLVAWLYDVQGTIVGYGLLRRAGSRWWTSIGVLPHHGGNGYGGAMMADLVRRIDEQVWSTALVSNLPAQHLHREADWEETSRDDTLVHYKTRESVWQPAP